MMTLIEEVSPWWLLLWCASSFLGAFLGSLVGSLIAQRYVVPVTKYQVQRMQDEIGKQRLVLQKLLGELHP